jgi:Amt family ammonium transporter
LTIVLAAVATAGLAYLLKVTIGLRPTDEDEEIGLDLSDHGERGYHTGEYGGGHPERDDEGEHGHAGAH